MIICTEFTVKNLGWGGRWESWKNIALHVK